MAAGTARDDACELCRSPGGELLWEDGRCRVVRVVGEEGDAYPGYCRVVWRDHVREMSDLAAADRGHLFGVLVATERAVREAVHPDKINLASLGNLVPHLHWHVIPRWNQDSRFPSAIWAPPRRPLTTRTAPGDAELRRCLHESLDEMRMP